MAAYHRGNAAAALQSDCTSQGISPARLFLFLLGITLFLSNPAEAGKRVALVVGNSNYKNVSPLNNPRNDAKLVADTLRGIGFFLIGGREQTDLDKGTLDIAIQTFGNELAGADVALFYYAGHGIQVRGSNYIVPINANPTKEADIDFQMVDVAIVLRQMEGAGTKFNLMILDACRNNPFATRGLRSSEGGLAQMRAPEGTLISYATQPGSVAQDGDGNSPYTKALAQNMRRPGLDIFQTFNEVGLAVKRSTGGQQQPWLSSSPIDGGFHFTELTKAGGPIPAASSSTSNDAAEAWSAVKDTRHTALLETFIQRYSSTFFADLARARLAELKVAPTSGPAQIAAVAPSSALNSPATVPPNRSERVVLYDEDPANAKGRQYAGRAVWRTEAAKMSGGQSTDIAVRCDIEIPDRKLKLVMVWRRNTDRSLPASHTAELTFTMRQGSSGGSVSNVPGILMKSHEQARGTPLAGLAVRVSEGSFLVGLSNVDADLQRNLQLLQGHTWFDIPMVYANQRRAIIAIEKGTSGIQAFESAFSAWGQTMAKVPNQ